jgi:hypothetical protein
MLFEIFEISHFNNNSVYNEYLILLNEKTISRKSFVKKNAIKQNDVIVNMHQYLKFVSKT